MDNDDAAVEDVQLSIISKSIPEENKDQSKNDDEKAKSVSEEEINE